MLHLYHIIPVNLQKPSKCPTHYKSLHTLNLHTELKTQIVQCFLRSHIIHGWANSEKMFCIPYISIHSSRQKELWRRRCYIRCTTPSIFELPGELNGRMEEAQLFDRNCRNVNSTRANLIRKIKPMFNSIFLMSANKFFGSEDMAIKSNAIALSHCHILNDIDTSESIGSFLQISENWVEH